MSEPPCPLAESHSPLSSNAIREKNELPWSSSFLIDLLNKIFEPDLSSIKLKKKYSKGCLPLKSQSPNELKVKS